MAFSNGAYGIVVGKCVSAATGWGKTKVQSIRQKGIGVDFAM